MATRAFKLDGFVSRMPLIKFLLYKTIHCVVQVKVRFLLCTAVLKPSMETGRTRSNLFRGDQSKYVQTP